jgi:uncharacterized protein (TIGR00251 family)
VRLSVKAVPGSSRDTITGWLGSRLKIRVRAPAESGKANKAIIALMANMLDIPKRSLRIVTGSASPLKILEIDGVSEEQLESKLALQR